MRKLICFIILLCSFTFFAGCSNVNEKNEAKATEKNVQTLVKQKQSFIIYRAAADGSEHLLPESISVEDNGKSTMENALIALISTKPQDAKYADVVPIGTKLLSLQVENNMAVANFSKELIRKNMGSYEELMLSYAIVNTLTEYPEIKKVQILVEGKKVVSGHMDWEEPLTRNNTLLSKKE